jgi:tetratricopeptide (TPR) repeat protein
MSKWLILALPWLMAGQTPQERDLRIRPDPKPPATRPASEPGVEIPRSYALVVGIGNYPGLPEEARLQFAERDAEAIYSVLISAEGGQFRAENVRRLIGPQATRENLRKELEEWLPNAAGENDRVLIYYAGHSFYRNGRVYLAPWDLDLERVDATGYPMASLSDAFANRIRGRWKILLADSCHSGAINPAEDMVRIRRETLDLSRSVFTLTASRDRERSFESTDWGGGHGIFTYYVVRGMEGAADESGDGIVTADELAEYVRRNVREATAGQQNPTSDKGSFDPEMLLAYVPSAARAAEPPVPKFGTLIIEANLDGVEVFVNGRAVGVVDKSKPLRLPGLPPGLVTIKGVRMGFEPDGPREEMVYPGQDTTVTLRLLIPRRRNKAAVEKFDEGMEQYNRGQAEAYRRAAARFREAFRLDPKFSQAALYAGRSHDALFELEQAGEWFRRAIEIDPDYLEARASYAGMLLGLGDVDEAVRQLNWVTRRDKKYSMAWYLQAQAYRLKGMYDASIESARRAIELTPQRAEAHFWLAESLRMKKRYAESAREYEEYLRLSDYDTKLAGRLHYYFAGYTAGFGKKKRAAQTDIWREMRCMAHTGQCENAKGLGDYGKAIEECRQALRYDANDPYAHYLLGLSYARQAEKLDSPELLAAAQRSFRTMLAINPDLQEAAYARANLEEIERALRSR